MKTANLFVQLINVQLIIGTWISSWHVNWLHETKTSLVLVELVLIYRVYIVPQNVVYICDLICKNLT